MAKILKNSDKTVLTAGPGSDGSSRSIQALLDRIDTLQDFYEYSPVGYLTLDRSSRILEANRAAVIMMKMIRSDLIGQVFYDRVVSRYRDTINSHLSRIFEDKKPHICKIQIQNRNGQLVFVSLDSIYAQDPYGRCVCRSVMVDITNRKLTEEEICRPHDALETRGRKRTADLQQKTDDLEGLNTLLQNLNQKIIQEHSKRMFLSKRLVEILERERRETAMALHDEAGQLLATLKMDLEMLERAKDAKKQTECLHAAKAKISDLISVVKNVSRQLRPGVLDTLGLVPAARSLVDRVREHHNGIDIDFFSQGVPDRMDPAKQTTIYRILQESMSNIIKHAEAKKIHISLIKKDNIVRLTAEDDGKGFDYQTVSKSAMQAKGPMGITIMRERAVQHGGSFWIDSKPDRGTYITVEIPI